MDKMYEIDSDFRVGRPLPVFPEEVVKNEPMFFSAQPSFALAAGGPITKAFLEAALFDDGLATDCVTRYDRNFCFDSRVHMLMPGWFPCIPGWHHDDVPRSRGDGQPNYENPEYRSKHILALVNGNICPTEFAVGKAAYPHVDGVVYKAWHELVEQDIADDVMKRVKVPTNFLVHFNDRSFHQGTRAVGRGFRWFGRLSYDAGYDQGRPHHNEIRRQVNVYLDMPMEGW
jgi:hypothetical protein